MSASPLAGRRVVVTRPDDQAALAALLEERGARPVVVPLTEVVDEPAGMAALAAIDPTAFDWVVVTSVNAARRLMAVHGEVLGDPQRDPIRPALAAVGARTATIIGRARLVPTDQRAEGLLAELPPPPTPSGSVLVVHAVDAAPTLVDGLRERGWAVVDVAAHRSVARHPGGREQLAALAADVVLFAAGSAARAWVEAFGTTTPPVVVAMGPQTASVARAVGLEVTVVASEHTLAGLVDAAEQGLGDPQ